MNDEEKKNEVLDQENTNTPGLTKKLEKALRRKEFFKSHPKLEWFYNHMTLSAILSFFFVLFVVFFFRGCTEDTTKYNSSIQDNNISLVESSVKRAVGWNDEHTYYESYNIWDEEWEVGLISTSNGSNVSNSSYIRSKNYNRVLPNTNYYIKSGYQLAIIEYDANYTFIRTLYAYGSTITTSNDCRYIRFFVNSTSYGTTYNYDICINVSDERINGLYFPGGNLYPQSEYEELFSSYNTLQENYNNLVTSYQNLQNEYDTLNTNYNSLNSQFEDLQASYNALQTQYNNLKILYDNLVSTFNELNGSNAFEVSNLGPFVFVTRDGTTNKLPILQLPNFESSSLGSSLPLIYNADEVKYTYKTPVYFKQGTIVRLSTSHTYQYPVNVKISLYDSDNSLIGDFTITFDFSTVSLTGVYVGSYEFVSDVGNISSIVFTDISSNGELGVTRFELASDPYQRGYHNGYLARSDDYYQMLNNYNEEVEKYNALYDEYQTYKETYNASVVASARAAGIEEGANADNALSDGFLAVFNAPFALTYRLLDFNVLGLNMWVLAVSLASIVVLVKLVKVIF